MINELKSYAKEHRSEVWRFIKHLGPYMGVVGVVIVGLVGAGWLDLPARSQVVAQLTDQQDENVERLERIREELQHLKESDVVQTNQLQDIEGDIEDANAKLDTIIERLLDERNAR